MLLIALLVIFIPLCAQTAVPPAAGSGTSASPYQIATLENLYWISLSWSNWNNHFIQTADIDARPTQTWFPNGLGGFLGWAPIGTEANPFAGFYDGQNYLIEGLYINRPNDEQVGLFGKGYWANGITDNTVTIKQVGLNNVNIQGGYRTGAIIGYLLGATNSRRPVLMNCFSSGSVSGTNEVGGLLGSNVRSMCFDNYSLCNVSGTNRIGGLTGYLASYASVERSYFQGSVSGIEQVGGITGYANNYATVINSYNMGSVSGNNIVGGLSGGISNDSSLKSSYSTGSVVGNSNTGGVNGEPYGGTCVVWGCFWDTQTPGIASSAGGTGKTTVEMKQLAMYSTAPNAPFDFTEVWYMIVGETRPMLRTEYRINIRNLHQLQLMRLNPAGDYLLVSDVNLANIQNPCDVWGTIPYGDGGFVPIGTTSAPFTGSLNGNSFHLTNLYINRGLVDYQSLLGYCSSAEIVSVSISDSQVGGQTYTGGLASKLANLSTITNCSYSGIVSGTWHFTGGLVGDLNNSSLSMCYSDGSINTTSWAGGLVGMSSNGASITNCYSRSIVDGNGRVGGLIGGSYSDAISNSYSTGCVSGYNAVGGFIGEKTSGSVENCFWNMDTSNQSYSAGMPGVVGKTSAEMRTLSTFTSAGWDFVGETANGSSDIWNISSENNAGYPYLQWQPYEIIVPGVPQNVIISYNDALVTIIWDEAAHAMAYKIYSCPVPDGDYLEDVTGVFNGTSWSAPPTEPRMFYRVRALRY
jgi:hypothetical protein